MKILLIHYRYSVIGGPERYLFNVKDALEEKGHEVIPFSVAYPDNEPSEYEKYFVTPLTNEFHLHKAKLSIFESLSIARKMIYNKEAYNKLSDLINDVKPDIAYVLIYKGKLTYSIFDALNKSRIPIILRVSDFSLLCGKNIFYRDNKICTLCLKEKCNLIKYKCVHDSYIYSSIIYLSMIKQERDKINSLINEIISPSLFTASFLKNHYKYQTTKITHLPTFTNIENYELSHEKIQKRYNDKIITFIGRISEEKGVSLLVNSLINLKKSNFEFQVVLTGFSDNEYSFKIKELIRTNDLEDNIKCIGFIEKDELFDIIDRSYISVVPSICYDNMPNSLIESQSFGVPIIASNLGSFPELIMDNVNGLLFEHNNMIDLSEKIKKALSFDINEYTKYSNSSIKWVNDYCSKDKHIEKLITIFSKYI